MLQTQFIKRIQLKRDDIPSFQQYPFDLPCINGLTELEFHPHVTFIVGENGMGKSTMLEAIAISLGFNPEGGTLNFNFRTFDSHSNLDQYLKVIRGAIRPKDGFFLRAESFYNVATNIDQIPEIINAYGGISLHEQSHGEAFFATFNNRFRGNGIYILDEPEAALSPLRQMAMITRIHDLVRDNSQFIIATHSPIIMSYPSAKVLELTEAGIRETTVEDTNHFRLMKQFFEDKNRVLHHLLED